MPRISAQRTPSRSTPDALRRMGRFACLDFINSTYADWRGERGPTDTIERPDWWKHFLGRWELPLPATIPPAPATLRNLRHLRALMRSAVEGRRSPRPLELAELNRQLRRSPHLWSINARKGRFSYTLQPSKVGWRAVVTALILSFGELMSRAELERLKKCANPNCTYLFYDVSTNRSRRWCFSNVCGNLMHVRAFRARHTGASGM